MVFSIRRLISNGISHAITILNDNVRHYAHICEVISEMLVMAVTSYPIFSHPGDHDEQVK
jgi:hypothetical protein